MAQCNKLQAIIVFIIIMLYSNSYALDESYNTEMAGLVYLNIPLDRPDKNNFSPTFGFAVTTARLDFNHTHTSDIPPLLLTTNQRKMVDIQFNLENAQFTRFAFGGIDALVNDYTMQVNGGGPVIDPGLVILGLSAGGLTYLILSGGDNNDGNNMDECDGQQPSPQTFNFAFTTLNLDNCQPPPD